MTTKHDTKGRIITRKTLNRSMAYSLIGGGFGSVWFLFTSPQQLLILLVKTFSVRVPLNSVSFSGS